MTIDQPPAKSCCRTVRRNISTSGDLSQPQKEVFYGCNRRPVTDTAHQDWNAMNYFNSASVGGPEPAPAPTQKKSITGSGTMLSYVIM
jgi:hypothetical protein